MKIKKIELFRISLPLNFTFKTAKESLNCRELLIIKVTDDMGFSGFGEVVSFTTPFYTDETLEISQKVLLSEYFPLILNTEIIHPFDIHKWNVKKWPMAIAGLENSLLDLYAKKRGQNAVSLVFGEKLSSYIDVGVTLGDFECSTLCKQIEEYKKLGCNRFKIKVKAEDGFGKMQTIREEYADINLLVDANRSYRINQIDEVRQYDSLNLLCIEEPFEIYDFNECENIQKAINTPICLDESVQTLTQLQEAIKLNVFSVLNVKIGRLGGIYYAKHMIDICRNNGILYWIGSMVESGISKILHVQMSALSDVYIPGDISDSKRYFKHDLIYPEISSENGKIKVPHGTGIGININQKILDAVTNNYWIMGENK